MACENRLAPGLLFRGIKSVGAQCNNLTRFPRLISATICGGYCSEPSSLPGLILELHNALGRWKPGPAQRLYFLGLSASCLVLFFDSASQPAQALSARQQVQTQVHFLSSDCDELVKQVQMFLTAAGRWAPAPTGKDMQLCQALEGFQKKVGQLNKDNNGQNFDKVRTDLQELEFQSQLVVPLLSQTGANQNVLSAWMKCRNDLLAAMQVVSAVPGPNQQASYDAESTYLQNPASPFGLGPAPVNINITRNSTFDEPGGPQNYANTNQAFNQNQFHAGTNAHINAAVISSLSGADTQTERFVKQLTAYLQMKGLWPPPASSPEMQLCQNIQSFQLQLRKFRADLQSGVSYPVLQGQLQQMGASSQSIDSLLLQSSAPQDLVGRWNEVRSYMNSTYHSFLSAGSSYIWMR